MNTDNQAGPAANTASMIVVAATILAAVAGVAALKEKTLIIGTCIVGAVILVAIAVFASRRGEQKQAMVYGGLALIIALIAAGFGLMPGASGDSTPPPGPTTQKTGVSTPATQKSSPAVTAIEPVFRGTGKIVPGQAVDLEVASPQAESATGVVVAPHDVFVDYLSWGFDADGYLVSYSGLPDKGREGCKELLESGKPRGAMFALPNMAYCLRTSEGRIAWIKFGQGDVIGKVGNFSYRVWDN